MRLALSLAAAVLVAAGVQFARAQPTIEVRFPRTQAVPGGRHDLAYFANGSTVRASSADWARRHHPGYLASGRPSASLLEKWVSAPGDPEPWVEVQLDWPREVDEVQLELAGLREDAALTMRRFRIECFTSERLVIARAVEGNAEAAPRYPLRCPLGNRVRVTFQLEPGTVRDQARVYGLRVRGQ